MIDLLSSLHQYADIGLLVLRLCIAAIFLQHCRSKVGGKMGSFMTFIGVAELAGGLAMLLGFLTQLAALGLGMIMLGAIYKKMNEWKVPFSTMSGMGWEFDLMILGSCVALLFFGGGTYALDVSMFGL